MHATTMDRNVLLSDVLWGRAEHVVVVLFSTIPHVSLHVPGSFERTDAGFFPRQVWRAPSTWREMPHVVPNKCMGGRGRWYRPTAKTYVAVLFPVSVLPLTSD